MASAILITVHVFRDVIAEVKRLWKSRGEKPDQTTALLCDTAEDLADSLSARQVAHLLLGAPWCSFFGTLFSGILSLFIVPGARNCSWLHSWR